MEELQRPVVFLLSFHSEKREEAKAHVFLQARCAYVERNQSQAILNGLEGQSDQDRRETWKTRAKGYTCWSRKL